MSEETLENEADYGRLPFDHFISVGSPKSHLASSGFVLV
jgi:hypothetical protein